MGDGVMNDYGQPLVILLLIILVFSGGYLIGRNENKTPQKYDLAESQWDEVHSYRMCMDDRSCRMFVRIK